MAVNIQTIKEIRNYLLEELHELYPDTEINAMCNIIIQKLCNITKIKQLSEPHYRVDKSIARQVKTICKELITGSPLQYILGETVFFDCKIFVNRHVLIPRPETEELVDLIIKENDCYEGSIIDFGTGSGCIAIALACKLPYSKVQATDISKKALSLASKNADINDVKIDFVHSDVFDTLSPFLSRAGIIVSNPPYIRHSEKSLMQSNVLDFEPSEALFVPDNDPLLFYRAILETSKRLLLKKGKVYFEINEALGGEMIRLCESFGLSSIQIIKDINGKERFVKGIKND
jgi:release factor glutamine methyltransferase